MGDFLSWVYPWVKTLHIVAVVAWMAGLFYLPRLYVYHAERGDTDGPIDELLTTMERKLLRFIMNPSMIAVWVFGLMLVFTPGIVDWGAVWPYTKGASVLAMTWFHHWLAYRFKDFREGRNTRTGRTFRMMNELPTLLLILIVASVVVKF